MLQSILLTLEEQKTLKQTAKQSVVYGLKNDHPLPVDIAHYTNNLTVQGASFVTLNIQEKLRGCIGALKAYQPLIKDVSKHAYMAAFKDARFPPITPQELNQLTYHISVLSPYQPLSFTSEQNLISEICPGTDGLILIDNGHQGTFLPSVWRQIPTPAIFIQKLKQKAGLPIDYWSESIKVFKYTVFEF